MDSYTVVIVPHWLVIGICATIIVHQALAYLISRQPPKLDITRIQLASRREQQRLEEEARFQREAARHESG